MPKLSGDIVANINFYRPEHGGMDRPPMRYLSAPIALSGDDQQFTLMMDFIYVLDRQRVAYIEFLVEDAPSDQLVEGCTFEIFQGDDVIGKGLVTKPKKS